MPSFSIESNGRLETTTIYFNGEQLGGVREVFLNLDEDGTFDAILQYVGSNGETFTKQIFNDHLESLVVTEPSLTEDEARARRLLTVDSSGDIEDTMVLLDEEPLDGMTNLMVHIKGKANTGSEKGIRSLFKTTNEVSESPEFRAEATYRNDDESLSTERIF
ncbi:MAG: hypothetical protein H7X80_03205 [bacterium]|nr:hypothetical protein [Candidatus Kapabacteria bacterium]